MHPLLTSNLVNSLLPTVADLEMLIEGFSFTKTPAQLELKTKNKVITNFVLSHFSLTGTSCIKLATCTTPKSTHWPYFKVIFALCPTNHHKLVECALSEGVSAKSITTPCIHHWTIISDLQKVCDEAHWD